MITAEKPQTATETMARVKEIYEGLKVSLDTPENRGRFVTIDTLSGDYEVGGDRNQDIIENGCRLRERHAGVVKTGTLRIGYKATFSHCPGRHDD